MDFGVVGLDGLVGSEATGFSSLASDPETKQKWYGSGLFKQERSGNSEDDWRSSKLLKTDDFVASKTMQLQHRNTLLRSNYTTLYSDGQQQQQQMLSFSSPKSESFLAEKNSHNATLLPYFHHSLSGYGKNTGTYIKEFDDVKVKCLYLIGTCMEIIDSWSDWLGWV